MELKTMKALALTSAVALGLAVSSPANAQSENVSAQLITSSAIDTVLVSDMDFGEYLIQHGTDTPLLTLTNDGSVAVNVTGVTDSQVVQITAPATEGVVTVEIPAPGDLDLTSSNLTNFADTNVVLDIVTYRTATETGQVVTTGPVTGVAVPVTVLAGATPETVTFGGVVEVVGTPGDATHTASFDVTFAYP